jgi:hypothetical protein
VREARRRMQGDEARGRSPEPPGAWAGERGQRCRVWRRGRAAGWLRSSKGEGACMRGHGRPGGTRVGAMSPRTMSMRAAARRCTRSAPSGIASASSPERRSDAAMARATLSYDFQGRRLGLRGLGRGIRSSGAEGLCQRPRAPRSSRVPSRPLQLAASHPGQGASRRRWPPAAQHTPWVQDGARRGLAGTVDHGESHGGHHAGKHRFETVHCREKATSSRQSDRVFECLPGS